MALELVDIVGLVIGILSIVIGLPACYYAYASAKRLGGKIGKAFTTVAIGCVLMIFSAAFQGITMGALNIYQNVAVAIISSGSALLGTLFLIVGFRGILASTKP